MRSRSGGETIKLISLIVFAALIVYITSGLFGSMLNPLKTTAASTVTVEDIAEISGYILRTEEPIYGSGYTVTVREGDKISVGESMAVRYDSEDSAYLASEISSVKARIKLLEDEENARKTEEERRADSILRLSRAVSRGDTADIDSAVGAVRAYIMGATDGNGLSLSELYEKLSELEKRAETKTSYIKSKTSGIFSLVTDGYENITVSDVKSLTPDELKAAFSDGSKSADDCLGKLITGLTWYYDAVMDKFDADKFSVGDRVDIDFTLSFGQTVRMDVESIGKTDENGKCTVLFSSNKFIADTASLRASTGRILFSSISGIMIPKSSLHYNKDGNPCVYILVGLQAREVGIEILSETDKDTVIAVQNDGNDTILLREGADIIVKGKNLYDSKVVK